MVLRLLLLLLLLLLPLLMCAVCCGRTIEAIDRQIDWTTLNLLQHRSTHQPTQLGPGFE